MQLRKVVVFYVACLGLGLAADPIVLTKLGPVRGSVMQSRKNVPFLAFRGMRYAEPPVGDLRFKPPVPVRAWAEEYNATADGAVCSQPGGGEIGPKSEDCLFINVYTREVNITKDDELKHVLVYLHAGGFYSITGQSVYYGPDYLLDQDIVLVTLNYRLATLGFLSTGDGASVGNYGMKDQVEALRWVQRNINVFGGDPTKVTLGGYSAGAASVMLHMVSPMSKGLFSKAIAMSGSAANAWAINKDPLALAKKQAQLLSCPTDNTTALVNCIKDKPAQDTARIYSGLWGWGYDPIVVLSPVVEPDLGDGSERFLTEDPVISLQKGNFAQIPLIIGTTYEEFSYRAAFVTANETWARDMSENWDRVAPIPFMFDPDVKVSSELRKSYLGDLTTPISEKSLPALGKLYADSVIIFGSQRSAKLVASSSSAPVYVYQFTYAGEYSHAEWSDNQTHGPVHHDDLLYLFYISAAFPRFNATGEDASAVDRSTTLWTNFMRTGNPTPKSEPLLNNVIWTPYTTKKPTYLEIGTTLTNKPGLYYSQRISTWENLFPLTTTTSAKS